MNFEGILNPGNLSGVEKLLKDNLVPVRPRPEFVAGLRQKLVEMKPEPPVLTRGWRALIVSTAGVFSGLLIVGAVVRIIGGVVWMMNLIRQLKPAKPKGAASVSPA